MHRWRHRYGSRLEGLTKFYNLPLLVSEFTRAEATDFAYMLVDKVRVKGKLLPIRIYMPIAVATAPTIRSRDQALDQALAAYFGRDFTKSHHQLLMLQQLLMSEPTITNPTLSHLVDISRLVDLYLQRVEQFRQQDPGPDWDGSHAHHDK